jgi:RNA polymerase sigma-70 factor (ECF subfamily)
MDDATRAQLEESLRSLCGEADYAGAVTSLLRGYGPELFGFLMAIHQSEVDAGDSFSDLAEALWRGLPGFAWESSVRTWAYAIARNVSRVRKRDAARRGRRVANVVGSSLEGLVHQVRTETISILRGEKRSRLQALRDSLSEADRMLLVLRIDRDLAWNDVARVIGVADGETAASEADLARDAARLRKRYQAIRDRLRELAKREGLLE